MSIDRRTRQSYRDSAGRYDKTPGCERCGRHRAIYSDPRCNDELNGRGLILCRKCAEAIAILSTADALADLAQARGDA